MIHDGFGHGIDANIRRNRCCDLKCPDPIAVSYLQCCFHDLFGFLIRIRKLDLIKISMLGKPLKRRNQISPAPWQKCVGVWVAPADIDFGLVVEAVTCSLAGATAAAILILAWRCSIFWRYLAPVKDWRNGRETHKPMIIGLRNMGYKTC